MQDILCEDKCNLQGCVHRVYAHWKKNVRAWMFVHCWYMHVGDRNTWLHVKKSLRWKITCDIRSTVPSVNYSSCSKLVHGKCMYVGQFLWCYLQPGYMWTHGERYPELEYEYFFQNSNFVKQPIRLRIQAICIMSTKRVYRFVILALWHFAPSWLARQIQYTPCRHDTYRTYLLPRCVAVDMKCQLIPKGDRSPCKGT